MFSWCGISGTLTAKVVSRGSFKSNRSYQGAFYFARVGIINTGHGVCVITLSAVLPNKKCSSLP